jgi:hypothetical protein
MPEELRGKLAAAAARSGRSLNAELVQRLEKSLRPSPERAAAEGTATLIRKVKGGRAQVLRPKHRVVIGAVAIPAALLIALLLAFAGGSGGTQTGKAAAFVKAGEGGDPDSAANSPGLGPVSFDAYQAAERTYPANVIPPAIAQRAEETFNAIAGADAKNGDPKGAGHKWQFFGPKQNATQPGVISFSGATNNTASRVTALVADPSCTASQCRLWAGIAGGGVWRTDNAVAPNPIWQQVSPKELDQNSVGTLTLDPNDPNTLYLGTGEANRCSSGCEAGVGIYKSTDGGNHWTKLADACVNNATYNCATTGIDAFLGRGINSIVIDPRDSSHILVGSALGVRGLNHVIGAAGETQRFEPGANEPGVYESHNGGATFTEVWNGAKPDAGGTVSFGITDLGLDPLNPDVVYAAGFDAGAWRRDAGAAATAFQRVFAPQFNQGVNLGAGIDRTMFALTVKNNKTRIYLTDGTAAGGGPTDVFAANFWRTDNANNLTAAALLASQGSVTPTGAACVPPNPATHIFPASYNTGWQCLTSRDTANPYFPTQDFCWAQCWYDENVYTPAGMPDTVYVIGAMQYDEQPCDTKGVGCGGGHNAAGQGAGMSNGRAVLYSNTAGDPDAVNGNRTFTDLTTDDQDTVAPWCAFQPYFATPCRRASNSIHPDQHAIVINPGNPTQIFEGSDGGVIRTSGTFADISSQCDEVGRDGVTGGPVTGSDNVGCKRLLSRVPVELAHIDRNLSSTIQFINTAIDPFNSCRVLGGTQDNGTWSNLNGCGDRNTFTQVIYGDGGNAVFDAAHPNWMANGFTSGAGDVSFENGDPQSWVVATAPIRRSGEGPSFYWPQVGDPNPVPGTHPIYEGAKHVWRSWAFNGGHPTQTGPQDMSPDIPYMESNCPEFVIGSTNIKCGDQRPLGGPYCDGLASTPTIPSCINQPGDLTGTVYGSDRGGGSVSWIARDSADHGTIWAATSAGRIFVTHNGDAVDPSTVTWTRIDNSVSGGSPTRFPSSIYVDPANSNHAWISYSGYNAVTPTKPGHVFSVVNTGTTGAGTFTNLHVENGSSAYPTPTNDGDLPIADVVRDDATHTLYAATDFGVLRGDNDGASWHVTDGMPRYEVMHLAIQPSSREPTCMGGGPCKRVLYAATHSQGIWQMRLGGAH